MNGRLGFWCFVAVMSGAAAVVCASVWNTPAPPVQIQDPNLATLSSALRQAEAQAGTLAGLPLPSLENRNSQLSRRAVEPGFEEEGLSLEEVQPGDENDELNRQFLGLSLKTPTFIPAPYNYEGADPIALTELPAPGSEEDASQVAPVFEKDMVWRSHRVASGESLSDIASKYGISIALISKANNLKNVNRLSAGQELLIPRSDAEVNMVLEELKRRSLAVEAEKKKALPLSYEEYTVANGESLWTIAGKFNLSIDTILGNNQLKNPDVLSVGTKLRIPNQDGISLKVAKGMTVESLSKKYEISPEALRMANSMDGKKGLQIGQMVFLPGASPTVEAYKSASASGGATTKAPQVAQAPSGSSGSFAWPLRGNISSPFGWRRHPLSRGRSFHTGIDIRSPRHTPIRAARGGQVIFAGWMGGYGRVVVVKHDSRFSTLYAHAQTLLVRKGQRVSRGDKIATVGTSGRSTGPHVHFEVRSNNKPTNPMSYLR